LRRQSVAATALSRAPEHPTAGNFPIVRKRCRVQLATAIQDASRRFIARRVREFFGFRIHGEFQHGQTIGGGVEQFPLRGRAQIRRGFGGSTLGHVVGPDNIKTDPFTG